MIWSASIFWLLACTEKPSVPSEDETTEPSIENSDTNAELP